MTQLSQSGGPDGRGGGRARFREPFSTQVDPDLKARVRTAIRGVNSVARTDYTLAAFVEDALQRHCQHLEDVYNDGQRWPADDTPLRPGAPLRRSPRTPAARTEDPSTDAGTGPDAV